MNKRKLAALIATLICTAPVSSVLAAEGAMESTTLISIPSGDLDAALKALVRQTGVQLLYDRKTVEGMRTQGVKEARTAQDAISQLLEGTALTIKTDSSGAILIAAPVTASLSTGRVDASGYPPAAMQVAQSDSQTPGTPAGATTNSSSQSPDRSSEGADEQRLEEIVVTGTHIRGNLNPTTSLVILDREAIDRSGYTTMQELVRSLPQNFSGGTENATEDGLFGTGSKAAQNFTSATSVNLRGLGTSSTLTLLDGHRIAPSGHGDYVDISLIPLAAVERIEILTSGASAIYGADAVGGVVNIILKKNFEGATTSLNYGAATNGGRSDRSIAQTLGGKWEGGNVMGTLQYQSQNALQSSDRDFTATLPPENELLPDVRSYSAVLSARQAVTTKLDLYGDALFTRREVTRFNRVNLSIFGDLTADTDTTAKGFSGSLGLRYALTPRWSADLGGTFSQQKAHQRNAQNITLFGDSLFITRTDFKASSLNLILNGKLFATGAGEVGLALGASYLDDDLEDVNLSNFLGTITETSTPHSRNNKAVFAEVSVPLVAEENALPGVQALDFSASVRSDDYSDFGASTNPRFALRWSPWFGISLRAAYSESFRAPSPTEVALENLQLLSTFSDVPNPAGGTETIFVLGGGSKLDAERARSREFGIDYRPESIRDLSVSLSYYFVDYLDRIASPSFALNFLSQQNVYAPLTQSFADDAAAQAFLDSAIASGAQFSDFVGTGAAGVRHLFDQRQANIAQLEQSGADLLATYAAPVAAGTLLTRLNVTYIDEIDTRIISTADSVNVVNTFGMPVHWRVRLDSGWSDRRFTGNLAANFVGAYTDTRLVGNPDIGKWFTMDAFARLNLGAFLGGETWEGATVSLSIQNLFDREPPSVLPLTINDVGYDPTNANPLQRFISMSFQKQW